MFKSVGSDIASNYSVTKQKCYWFSRPSESEPSATCSDCLSLLRSWSFGSQSTPASPCPLYWTGQDIYLLIFQLMGLLFLFYRVLTKCNFRNRPSCLSVFLNFATLPSGLTVASGCWLSHQLCPLISLFWIPGLTWCRSAPGHRTRRPVHCPGGSTAWTWKASRWTTGILWSRRSKCSKSIKINKITESLSLTLMSSLLFSKSGSYSIMIGDFNGERKKLFSVKRSKKYFTMTMPWVSTWFDEMYTPKMFSISFTYLWNFSIFFKYSVSKM